MGTLSKFVRGLGWLWIGLAVLVNLVVYAMIFLKQGFWALQDALSPFDFRNYITVGITFVPGAVLVMLADAIQQRQTRKALGLLAALPVAVVLVLLLFYAANATRPSSAADERVREYKAGAVRVVNGSAMMRERRDYLVTEVSGPVGNEGLPDVLRLGDVVTVKGKALKVNHIFVSEYLAEMKWGKEVLAKAGDVKCIVVESEDSLPYRDEQARRNRLWITIEQCRPISTRADDGASKPVAQLIRADDQALTCNHYVGLADNQKFGLAYGYLEGVQAWLDKEPTDILVPPSDSEHPMWWALPPDLGDKPFSALAEKLTAYCTSPDKRSERLPAALLAMAQRKGGWPSSIGIAHDKKKTDPWKKFLGGSVSCAAFLESPEATRDALVFGYYIGTNVLRLGLKIRKDVGLAWPSKSTPQSVRLEAEQRCAKEKAGTVRDVLWLVTAERAVREKK